MSAGAGDERLPTVVFVSAVTGHGGPNATLRSIVPRLEGLRRVLVGPYATEEVARWRAAGVEVETMPRPRGARPRLVATSRLLRIAWKLRRSRPLLFANGLTEAAILVPALLVFRFPLFVWIHNFAAPRVALALSPLLRSLSPRRVELAAVSQMAAAVGRRVFGPAAVTVLPNPIEDRFWSVERQPAAGRRLRVSYLAGTDRRYKGFDLLPDVLLAADDVPVDWRIVAAGATQPEAWERLRRAIAGLRSSTATIEGRSERIEELYRVSDVVFVPSRQESFCRVAAEAMASGAAVVASRLEAVEEVCGEVGFYFPPEDAAAAAAVLRRLAAAPAEVEEAGRRGRARARRFTVETVTARLEELLRAHAMRGGLPGA